MDGVGTVDLGIGAGTRIELDGGVSGSVAGVCGSNGICGMMPWSSVVGIGGSVIGSDVEPREGPCG